MTETELIDIILNGIEKMRRLRKVDSYFIASTIKDFIDANKEQLNLHNVSVSVSSAIMHQTVIGINCLSSNKKIIQTIHSR